MERVNVSSSNITSVGFEGNILEIEFHGGEIYQYAGVSEAVYHELISAGSVGSYFHANIKDKYTTTQIR